MPIDAGGGKRLRVIIPKPPTGPKPKKLRKITPPVSDAQSSGGDYGLPAANTYKKTAKFKQAVAAAKPARQTDATSSGPGYGEQAAQKWLRAQYVKAGYGTLHHTDPSAPENVVTPDELRFVKVKRKKDWTDAVAQSIEAPALQVLAQTTRPIHAIAGLAQAGGHGFTEGLLHNRPYSFKQVLKKAGVGGTLASIGGFVGDVGLDPTTYATFGTGSVARKAILDAGERAAAKAAEAGMSKAGQETVRKAAERVATTTAREGKGLTVKFGKTELPGVRRFTAGAGRRLSKVKPAGKGTVREVVREFRPTLPPAGTNPERFAAAREAARSTRAQINRGQATAEAQARGIRKKIGPDNYQQVIDAIETNNIGKLPPELRDPAIALRSSYRQAKKLRRRAGIAEGDVTKTKGEGVAKGYFPHAQDTPLKQGLGIVESDTEATAKHGGTLRRPGSAKARTEKRPLHVVNPERAAAGAEPFSTDIPLVHINYQRQTAKAVASADLEKRLAATGRQLHPGKDNALALGEGIFHLGYKAKGSPFKLTEIKPTDWEKGSIPKSGQFVALDKKTVEAAREYGKPTQAESQTGRAIDRGTRIFKGIATATPGFHMRNLVGDTQLAYFQQPGHKLVRNLAQGAKATRVLNQQRKAVEDLALGVDDAGKSIKVAGKRMPVGEFLKLAQEHGVTQSGYLTRELRDLSAEGTKGGLKRLRKLPRITNLPLVHAITQDRENMIRLATFKDALDRGLPPAKAASRSLEAHIDYADLTRIERQYARRLMPFYTFSARALPFQVKRLATNPGKFATIEKAREDFGTTDVSPFSTYQQRQVPLVVGGKAITDSLPLVLLNEVPTTANPGKYGLELGQFLAGLVNPLIKDPVELYGNRSFTFRDNIQDPQHPLVSAPNWVSAIPTSLRSKLGIVKMLDKKSGKKVWGWPGRLDYEVRAFMLGPFNQINQVSASGLNRAGQDQTSKVVSGLTGVRVQSGDAVTQQINRLYGQLNRLTEKQHAFNQQGINAHNPTKEYAALSEQMKQLEARIYGLSQKRGDKQALFARGKKLVRSGWGGSTSSGGGWGSGPAVSSGGWGQ